jgi:RNA recognition motif-containing protein
MSTTESNTNDVTSETPSTTIESSSTTTTTRDEETNKPHVPVNVEDLQSARVYVGNLSFKMDWRDVKDYFNAEVGPVAHVEIISNYGRSRGCAVVEFESKELAARAINEFQNKELAGRKLYLREDREAKGFAQRPARGGFQKDFSGSSRGGRSGYQDRNRGGFGGFRDNFRNNDRSNETEGDRFRRPESTHAPREPGTSVYFGNLPFNATWYDLKDLCRQFGNVLRSDISTDRQTGHSRGFGTVRFSDADSASAAILALNEVEFQGRKLNVRLDKHN